MDKNKTIKFLWISMWATLILMVALKLTFNYYYPIVIENSKLLEISYFIDNNKWLDYILNFILYIGNCILISLCVLHEKWFANKKQIIILASLYCILYVLKIINTNIASIFMFIPYLAVPIFITKKPRKWIFITFILDVLFQLLSNFVRGNGIINENSFVIRNAMLLDYYLLFTIYYIGGIYMGLATILPFFCKKETVINAKIEKLQKKIKKLEVQKQCLKKH